MRCCDTMLIMLRLPSQRLIRIIAVPIGGPWAWMSPTFSLSPNKHQQKIEKPISPSSNKTCQDPAAPPATAVLQPCSPGPADCNYPGTGTTGHRCIVGGSNFDIDHCCNIDIHNLEEVLFLVESASSKSFL